MILKKIILLVFGLNFWVLLQGQEFKVSIEPGIDYNISLGNKIIEKDGITTPSLFNNYKRITGLNLYTLFNINRITSAGLYAEYLQFGNWQNDQDNLYKGSEAEIILLGPSFNYIFNVIPETKSFQVSLATSTFVGKYGTKFRNSVYEIYYLDNSMISPDKENGFLYGLQIRLKLARIISSSVTINLNGGLKYMHLESYMSPDTNLLFFSTGIGLAFNRIRNKTYFIY